MSKKTKLSISEFARYANCSRQNISKLIKNSEKGIGEILVIENKKLDINNPDNETYLSGRKKLGDLPTDGKSVKIKKKIVKNIIDENIDDNENLEIEDDDENLNNIQSNGKERQALEIQKLKAQIKQLDLKNSAARKDLIEIETLAEAVFNHLSALHQNVLDMPESFIDKYKHANDSGKSRSDLKDILTKPICQAIKDTINQVDKLLTKEVGRSRRSEKKENLIE